MQEAQQESEQQAAQPTKRNAKEPDLLPAKLEESNIMVPLDLSPACDEQDSPANAASAGGEPASAQGLTPLTTRQGQQAASPAASDDANTPHSQQGELIQRTRGMIAAETEAAMAPLLAAQSDVALAQWLAKLQGTLADEVTRHKEAQRRLKLVSRHCQLSNFSSLQRPAGGTTSMHKDEHAYITYNFYSPLQLLKHQLACNRRPPGKGRRSRAKCDMVCCAGGQGAERGAAAVPRGPALPGEPGGVARQGHPAEAGAERAARQPRGLLQVSCSAPRGRLGKAL